MLICRLRGHVSFCCDHPSFLFLAEKPLERAAQHFQKHNFQTPIDEQDAASRVLDPIIAPLLAAQRGDPVEPPWGFFLKDYQKCEW
jgi:hypothetical protein